MVDAILILEAVVAPVVWVLMGWGGGRISRRREPAQKKDNGESIKWAWESPQYSWQTGPGFRCPKCNQREANKKQPKICNCLDFERDHFHFKCVDCEFTAIMRTADDP